MRFRTLALLLLLALITGFAAMNWALFIAPASLNLGLGSIQAPLGLVLLGLLGLLTLAFSLYLAFWQGTVLLETRRHAKEIQAQRELADQAEASRFTELKTVLQAEMAGLAAKLLASQQALSQDMREHSNALAAQIAELDDRMKQG
ncbi:putative integral membrane protein [Paucibacter oligotrophus]|uniref:Putative integral membrane protein n=1 Tax=Roseateles oligotrophus TaxID=1769250 RepID=A0A840LFT2_9BURK|nr:LapA family protein [Roseateles oligotrophus]MBB4844157.1 putative integral membrane protein [Roseateles oligotrophus]